MEGFRWRFIYAPTFGPWFVLSDTGWPYIGQQDRPRR